jgi:hypothetical protein
MGKVLDPVVLRACFAAYDDAVRTALGTPSSASLSSDIVRNEIANTVLFRAEEGERRSDVLREHALETLRSQLHAARRNTTAADQ